MNILEKVKSPKDLKKLSVKELEEVAKETRQLIIETTSKTGGHFATPMGATDLIIALHYVFESPKDKLVFDVGHQAYAHKIITGRAKEFKTLRQFEGISGYPHIEESKHDSFIGGHAGQALSYGLGLAEARDLKGEKFEVIVVTGDGSIGSGTTFEAFNNVGYLRANITIILNDNKMSISPNVGALSNHLKTLERMSEISTDAKPRRRLASIFENLGIAYLGPLDGHNMKQMIEAFQTCKKIKGAKVVHVITKKGKGFKAAEDNMEKWHGVSKGFDVVTGEREPKCEITYSEVFAKTLVKLGEKDSDIIAITAAMPSGTGLTLFAEKFPERFYDVGIAEEHAVEFGTGLAMQDLKPAVAIYSTFVQRAFDHLMIDSALMKAPVRLFLDRAGLVGDDGPTHHGCFDLSFLRLIPNFTIMASKDENELQHMVKTAMQFNKGPIALRYPKGCCLGVKMDKEIKELEIGKAEIVKEGNDLTIIAIGNMATEAEKAGKELEKQGISAEVINARFAKPLDEKTILKSGKKTGKVLTVEENALNGGFGEGVREVLEGRIKELKFEMIGIPDKFIEHGSQKILRENLGLSTDGIVEKSKGLK